MTLVVARRRGEEITIVSDTLITRDDCRASEHLRGAVVKSVMLSMTASVSFAGQVCTATETIHQFVNEWLTLPRDEIVSRILQIHIESKQGTDFIVAFLRPARLVCIKEGRAVEVTETAWIGQRNGFNAFQKFLNAGPPDVVGIRGDEHVITHLCVTDALAQKENSVIPVFQRSMKSAIEDQDATTVGGFPILLVTDNQYFRYGEYIDSISSRLSVEEFNALDEHPVGDEKGGSYTIYCSFAQNENVCVPIFYFPEGNVGLIFDMSQSEGMKSKGLFAWSFDEFLCKIRDVTNMRVASELPNEEQIRQISQAMLPQVQSEILLAKPQALNTPPNIFQAKRATIKIVDCRVIICETLDPVRDLTNQINGYIDRGRTCTFVHKATGRKLSLMDVFRKSIFHQKLVTGVKNEAPKSLLSYVQFYESSGERFTIQQGDREIELGRLVISGTVVMVH